MVQLGFRNGFGVDIESVSAMPLWCWVEGDDPSEDPPMVGVFDGLISFDPTPERHRRYTLNV